MDKNIIIILSLKVSFILTYSFQLNSFKKYIQFFGLFVEA